MSILFTQYLRPNGRKQHITIDLDPETEQIAHEMQDFGFYFDIEELQTGMISMTCEHPSLDDLVSIQVCPNGPGIDQVVKTLVEDGYQFWQQNPEILQMVSTWRKDLERFEEERKANDAAWDF